MHNRTILGFMAIAWLALAPHTVALAAATKVTPDCAGGFSSYDGTSKTCVTAPTAQQAADQSQVACEAYAGATWGETSKKCLLPKPPQPSCVGGPRVSFSEAKGACVYDDSVPISDGRNYQGDCFTVVSKIKGAPNAKHLYVVSQTPPGGDTLNVVEAELVPSSEVLNVLGMALCVPKKDSQKDPSPIQVSDVTTSGALRRGWVYGTLVVPYKYYTNNHQLNGTSSTVAPYFGRRSEMFGGAVSYIAAIGLGSVKGTVDDGTGKLRTTDANALSAAVGVTFEVAKSKSPFRMGFLVGRDYAELKQGVTYDQNRRTWIALQLGFDLTD